MTQRDIGLAVERQLLESRSRDESSEGRHQTPRVALLARDRWSSIVASRDIFMRPFRSTDVTSLRYDARHIGGRHRYNMVVSRLSRETGEHGEGVRFVR